MKTTRPHHDLKSAHVTPADGNVFADLGFSPKQAKAMLADADARIAKSKAAECGKLVAFDPRRR